MAKKPKPVPERYQTQPLWSHAQKGVILGYGVMDRQTGEYVTVHPHNGAMRPLLDNAEYSGGHTDQHNFITDAYASDKYGRKTKSVKPVTGREITRALLETAPDMPAFDSLKTNAYLRLVPLRYRDKDYKRVHKQDQGFALVDEKTGLMVAHYSEKDMRNALISMGCTKMRVGKYGMTSLDLSDGTRISADEFINFLVDAERPKRAYKKSKTAAVMGVAVGTAFVMLGAADGQLPPKISADYNEAAKHYKIEVVKRNPGDDPVSSYRAIQNPELHAMVENWFLHGSYKNLVQELSENGRAQIESEDPAQVTKLQADEKKIEHRMLWPVETARAVDTMWTIDPEMFKQIGYTPEEMLKLSLSIANSESYFGEQLRASGSSGGGYYHMLDSTFLKTVENYQSDYGQIEGLPTDRDDILKLRDDPNFGTKMLVQRVKELRQAGVSKQDIYTNWVLGEGRARDFARNCDESASASMSAAAADSNSSVVKGKTKQQAVDVLRTRIKNSGNKVTADGFFVPDMSNDYRASAMGSKITGNMVVTENKTKEPGTERHPTLQ